MKLYDCFGNRFGRHILAEVHNVKAVVLKQQLYNVFADIVYISVHGGYHEHALPGGLSTARHVCFYDLKGAFGGFRAHKKLGQIHRFVFKSCSRDVKGGNYFVVDNIERRDADKKLPCDICRPVPQTLYHSALKLGGKILCRSCGGRGGAGAWDSRKGVRCADISGAVFVKPAQRIIGIIGLHHVRGIGIHYCRRQAVLKCHGKKHAVDGVTAGQTEGHIGNAERGVAAKPVFYTSQRLKCGQCGGVVRADGHGQGVKNDIIFADSVSGGSP